MSAYLLAYAIHMPVIDAIDIGAAVYGFGYVVMVSTVPAFIDIFAVEYNISPTVEYA
jgi:hypothetical protein